jgi:hypothetical protein
MGQLPAGASPARELEHERLGNVHALAREIGRFETSTTLPEVWPRSEVVEHRSWLPLWNKLMTLESASHDLGSNRTKARLKRCENELDLASRIGSSLTQLVWLSIFKEERWRVGRLWSPI